MQILLGMQDDAVGSAAATLLHQLLHHLKLELSRQSGAPLHLHLLLLLNSACGCAQTPAHQSPVKGVAPRAPDNKSCLCMGTSSRTTAKGAAEHLLEQKRAC